MFILLNTSLPLEKSEPKNILFLKDKHMWPYLSEHDT